MSSKGSFAKRPSSPTVNQSEKRQRVDVRGKAEDINEGIETVEGFWRCLHHKTFDVRVLNFLLRIPRLPCARLRESGATNQIAWLSINA